MKDIDIKKFVEGMKEQEIKRKKEAKENCSKGIHSYGPCIFGGGMILCRCTICGHVLSVEDNPMLRRVP